MSDTAAILRQARNERGLTRLDLANRCAVSVMTVYRWEAGISTPRPPARQCLEGVLGVSFDASFISNDSPANPCDQVQSEGGE